MNGNGERPAKPLLRVVDPGKARVAERVGESLGVKCTQKSRCRHGIGPLRHIFQLDVVTCVRCGGVTRLLEAATTPEAIAKLLAKHGLGPRPPPPRAAPTGQLRLALSTA